MLSTLVSLLSLSALCLGQTTIGASQVAAAITSKDALQSLEDMGISVLSEILSSSIAIVIETQNPSASTTSSGSSTLGTSASSTASPTSSASLTSNDGKTGPTASPFSTTTANSSSNSPSHSDRNLAIILGALLGVLILGLLVTGFWLCCRRRKSRRAATPADEDEIGTWRRPMSQRNTVEETHITQPAPPYQPGVERPRSGVYAPIPNPYHEEANSNPFDDETYGYNSNRTSHPPAQGLGVYSNNNNSSSEEQERLHDRSQTPFFGASTNGPTDTAYNGGAAAMGDAPYNGAVVSRRPIATDATLQKGNRQSVVAEPMYSDATAYNPNGPWVPPAPARSPRRPRSLPRSPLAKDDGFNFGFEQQPMRQSLNGRYSAEPALTRGAGVMSPIGEAHQRF